MAIERPYYADILEYWLRHDSWQVDDALRLIAELKPGDSYGPVDSLSPEFDPWDFDLERAQSKYDRLWAIWRSGCSVGLHEEEYNPPAYYIDWAKEKRIDVPWLDWAEENGLIPAASSTQLLPSQPVDAPKSLTTKERTTFLTIIALLADEAKIDYRKPSKAADLLISRAESAGVQIGRRTIEEYLKQIPEALERRGKPEA